MENQIKPCCFCHGTMYRTHMPETFTLQGVTHTLPVTCFKCAQCGDIIYTADEVKRIDYEMHRIVSLQSQK